MGVDWNTCHVCGDTFPDCGHYGFCGGCDNYLCGTCLAKMISDYGYLPEEECRPKECDECTKSIIRDDDIVQHLLTLVGLTRKEVEDNIKLEREKS